MDCLETPASKLRFPSLRLVVAFGPGDSGTVLDSRPKGCKFNPGSQQLHNER